jgi:predicted small lipoprotein YifL
MKRALAASAVAALAVLAVTGCGSSGPSYFLASDNTAVLLVEWGPVSGGSASGTITYYDLTGTAPDEWVGVDNTPMTISWLRIVRGLVSFQGTSVTISPSALQDVFGGSKIPGTLSGDTLTLSPPPDASAGLRSAHVLMAASSQQYNAAVGKLQNEVTNENNTAASQQAAAQQARRTASGESALSQAVTALQNDVRTLAQEVTTARSDVTQADADLSTLESDAAGGQGPYCDNAYTVNEDAHTVNDDGYTMSDDVGTVEDDIADVNAGIAKVQVDVTAVHKDGGTVPKDAGTTVSNAQSTVSRAASTVNADVATVNGYLQAAYSDASSNAGSCNGPGQPSPVTGISGG